MCVVCVSGGGEGVNEVMRKMCVYLTLVINFSTIWSILENINMPDSIIYLSIKVQLVFNIKYF